MSGPEHVALRYRQLTEPEQEIPSVGDWLVVQHPNEQGRSLRKKAGHLRTTPLFGDLVGGLGDDLAHKRNIKMFVEWSEIGLIGSEHRVDVIPERRRMPVAVLDGHFVGASEPIGHAQNARTIE